MNIKDSVVGKGGIKGESVEGKIPRICNAFPDVQISGEIPRVVGMEDLNPPPSFRDENPPRLIRRFEELHGLGQGRLRPDALELKTVRNQFPRRTNRLG